MKKYVRTVTVAASLTFGSAAFAQGIPVIDAANVAQAILQVKAMADQLAQLQAEFNSMNGVRGMANLVNNPQLRNYLPTEYQSLLNGNGLSSGISGSISAIQKAAQITDSASAGFDPSSDAAKLFSGTQNQNAINRAVGEEGYRQASQRFSAIQQLLDKVNQAPDQKDILDLQGRIQAEQVMMQNEQTKLQIVAYLAQVQKDILQQQANESAIKSSNAPIPRF